MKSIYIRILILPALIQACLCNFTYDRVGDDYYFIGNFYTDKPVCGWFKARSICRDHGGQLVAVQTAEQLTNLQNYILSKGYANGSVFATSGHSFTKIHTGFKWDALQDTLNYTKWLPGDEPPPPSFLSLQLIDSELYMRRSLGVEQYYICEYESFYRAIVTSPHFIGMQLLCIISIILVIFGFIKIMSVQPKCNKSQKYFIPLKTDIV